MGFVNANADCALSGHKSLIDWVVCFIFVGGIGCLKRGFHHIMDSFENCIGLWIFNSAWNSFDSLANKENFKVDVAAF